ncbi:hypothetical protein GCM10007304_14710 [Rhodococcoides trifolii]|uniref:Uncharacterized protein n=1 Tax=Rhodococcoides trifolii TaxID=908250 RepID=A0A917CXD3_9NOCA|nr:hypothetical protein [Rhodococcus trifolii]GGG01755.1 hypothetical protein GCM10007304_14710 [Rhodococcus trifolii]
MNTLDDLQLELRQPDKKSGQTLKGKPDAEFREYISTGIYAAWKTPDTSGERAGSPLSRQALLSYIFREICAEIGANYPPGLFPYPSMAVAVGAAPGFRPGSDLKYFDPDDSRRVSEIIARAKDAVQQWLSQVQEQGSADIVPPPLPPIAKVVQPWKN